VVTEDCLDEGTMKSWRDSRADYDTYPAVMPKSFMIDFFTRRGSLSWAASCCRCYRGRRSTWCFEGGTDRKRSDALPHSAHPEARTLTGRLRLVGVEHRREPLGIFVVHVGATPQDVKGVIER
jgi:hypothetical protein